MVVLLAVVSQGKLTLPKLSAERWMVVSEIHSGRKFESSRFIKILPELYNVDTHTEMHLSLSLLLWSGVARGLESNKEKAAYLTQTSLAFAHATWGFSGSEDRSRELPEKYCRGSIGT